MRDIPFFTTEHGAAALTLSEVPYKNEAYIKILDTKEPELLLEDCCGFCKAIGAEHIYATGHDSLYKYPFHTAILRMRCTRNSLSDTDAALFPVQKKNMERWREIYNTHMRNVHNAATMTATKADALLQKGTAYYVHRDGQLLGIGIASGNIIECIISVIKGAGEKVLLALNHALSGDYAEVEVASENTPAIRLYERLGFVKVEEISRWYKIL